MTKRVSTANTRLSGRRTVGPSSQSDSARISAGSKGGGPRAHISHNDLQLFTPAKAPFDRTGWIFELKYDGFRGLAVKNNSGAWIISRNGNDLSTAFPEVVAD